MSALETPARADNVNNNTMDRPQDCETVPTDETRTHGLYPSLPGVDRCEACVRTCSMEQERQAASDFPPERQLDAAQPEATSVKMKAQMLVLEEQRQELLSINEKWAKEYRTMVQYYRERVRELKASLQQNHHEDETREEGEMHIGFNTGEEIQRAGHGDESELVKVKEEAQELRAQNDLLTRRGQHQREEIKRLNQALQDALQTTQPLHGSETLQDLWKHQAEVYKEDFLKERKDREKLKDKYVDLKKKFLTVHHELCVCKSQARTQPQPLAECSCTGPAKRLHWEVCPVNQHRAQRRSAAGKKP